MTVRKFFDGVQLVEIDDHKPAPELPVPSHSPDNSIHSLMAEPNADPSAKTGAQLADEWRAQGATVTHAIPVSPPNAGVGMPTPGREDEDKSLNHTLVSGLGNDTLPSATGGTNADAIVDPGLGGNKAAEQTDEFAAAQATWENKDAIRASIKDWGGEEPHASATRAELEEAAKEAFDAKQLA